LSSRFSLPDCDSDSYIPIRLGDQEKLSLFSNLARDGYQGLDGFLDDALSANTQLSRTAERLRKRMDRVVDEKKRQLLKRQDLELRKLNSDFLNRSESLRSKIGGDGLSGYDLYKDDHLEDFLLDDPLMELVLEMDEMEIRRRLTVWERIRAFFLKPAEALRRFWRWIRHLFKKKGQDDEESRGNRFKVLLNFPNLRGLTSRMDARMDNAIMTSPAFRIKLKNELRRRGAGKKGGGDDVDHMLEDYLRERMAKRKRALKGKGSKRSRLKELEKHHKRMDRERKRRLSQLKRKHERELGDIDVERHRAPRQIIKHQLEKDLFRFGYLKKSAGGVVVTSELIDRFAEVIFTSEVMKIPKRHRTQLGISSNELGMYEKGRLRTQDEISRMDMVESVIQSRINAGRFGKLMEDDVVTRRSIRGSASHVILVMDKSGSMEENGRIDAAKRSVLALYKAILFHNPANRVDVFLMDTRVKSVELMDVWRAEPGGFTNTSEALKKACSVLKHSRAEKRTVYLITDGLPEAYTVSGKARAGDLDKALALANDEAKNLGKVPATLAIFLLEPEKPMYVDATRKLAQAANGSVIVADPKNLAPSLLSDFSTR